MIVGVAMTAMLQRVVRSVGTLCGVM